METKIIPFCLETAKRIQAGKLKGTIKTKNGLTCKIVSYCDGTDFFVERTTEVNTFRWCYPYTKDGMYIDGKYNGGTDYDLILEVSEEAPEHQFKPFDKVLVRYPDKTELCAPNGAWLPGIFQYKSINSNLYFVSGKAYKDCIPYEGNEHLVYTTNKPKED